MTYGTSTRATSGFEPAMKLTEKRQLSANLKLLHGSQWRDKYKPAYNDRGLAEVFVCRFDDFDAIAKIVKHPIYWLEIEVPQDTDFSDVNIAIPLLVRGTAAHLECLRIDYVLDGGVRGDDGPRHVIPESAGLFRDLPHISRVDFSRVNFCDIHMRELATNSTIANVSVRFGDITKKCVKWLRSCPRLQYLAIRDCVGFTSKDQDWLRSKLPDLRVARVR